MLFYGLSLWIHTSLLSINQSPLKAIYVVLERKWLFYGLVVVFVGPVMSFYVTTMLLINSLGVMIVDNFC